MKNTKNIIIAGGAGFIGSYLCENLLKKGYIIHCIDNLSTGSFDNIKHLEKEKNFKFYKLDIVNDSIKINSKIDEIYHLASPASPKFYKLMPVETSLTNSIGTLNLLKFAVKHNAKFLFASTSEVYGNNKNIPQKEEDIGTFNHLTLKASYSESKRFGETLTNFFNKKYSLDTKIVRIFNTYGPRMRIDDGRVIPSFISKALKNEDIPVFDDGNQTRSFCYIDDIIKGLTKVMNCKYNNPINLGNPKEEITINKLAEKIKRLTNSKSRIVNFYDIKDDIRRRKPDITKAINILNWYPKYTLYEGLKITIRYYKDLIAL